MLVKLGKVQQLFFMTESLDSLLNLSLKIKLVNFNGEYLKLEEEYPSGPSGPPLRGAAEPEPEPEGGPVGTLCVQ
jgi:hypothetical protein